MTLSFQDNENFIVINSNVSNKTNIYINASINENQGKQIQNLFSSANNIEKIKNRVILTGRVFNAGENNIFINKYNLKNNIKFFFKDNNFNKPRIIFSKSYENVNNDDLFLFDNSNNLTNTDILYEKNVSINTNELLKIQLNFYNNFKYNELNSDYYKFKLNDFSLNNINNITNIKVVNDYSNNRLINNYNVSDFSNLLYNYDSNSDNIYNYYTNTPENIMDDSLNFLLYNKQSGNIINSKILNNYTRLDFDTNSTIKSIYFIPFKKYDYYSKKAGKILFYNNCIHFNSLILDNCSNFYNNNQNISPYKYYDSSNTIFLSLGNFMTGFTQKNLFKQTIINFDNTNNIDKLYFTSHYEPTSYIIPSELNNNYLIEKNDYSFNYIFDNIFYTNINNNNLKNSTINLNNYYYNKTDYSNNIYLNSFNNYNIQNNNNIININDYSSNYIIFNNTNFIFDSTYNLNTSILNNIITYDFRYNYDISFDVNYMIDINYINNDIDVNNINFFKIDFLTNFKISKGSIFNNVECIFIRYDPKNAPPEFTYPYNNIDICRNFQLDFLNTVIENIPGAKTSTTNTSFIPEKNGSNYSKKMIEGLIGFNDVPKLLAIKPYDESILIGRGFNNQLNFDNGTKSTDELQLTDQQIVDFKYQSQKHESQKKNKILNSKQRFANIARSRVLNRNININTTENCIDKPPNIFSNNYTTPFRFFKTSKGNYLRSGH